MMFQHDDRENVWRFETEQLSGYLDPHGQRHGIKQLLHQFISAERGVVAGRALPARFEAPSARAGKAGEDAQQGALSGAVGTENRNRFARFDLEVDASKRGDAPEPFFDRRTVKQDGPHPLASSAGFRSRPQCEQKRQSAVTASPQLGQ